MSILRAPCGCRSNAREWLFLCPAHALEHSERHVRAQKEKDGAELIGRYTLGPIELELVSKTKQEIDKWKP